MRLIRCAIATVCLVVLAGCGANTVEVSALDGTARVPRGDVLRVDLGKVNSSIGDSWHLVEKPDPAILSDGDSEYDSDCENPGCGGRLGWKFTARGPGTTTLVFRYCYRSRPDNCQSQPDRGPDQPVKLTVTVT
jgi:predicted secreted protein